MKWLFYPKTRATHPWKYRPTHVSLHSIIYKSTRYTLYVIFLIKSDTRFIIKYLELNTFADILCYAGPIFYSDERSSHETGT